MQYCNRSAGDRYFDIPVAHNVLGDSVRYRYSGQANGVAVIVSAAQLIEREEDIDVGLLPEPL